MTSAFQRVFPTFGDVGITHAWSGPIDRSVSGLPWFDALERDERVICAMGYSGTGVAPSAMGGRIIASLVLERDDEWSSLGMMLRRFQPQPTLPPEADSLHRWPDCPDRSRAEGAGRGSW